jgi:threonine/homoserine/homoserine lactone efflux protein
MSLFLLGALAGLGVAMPLGGIGVLLIREGVVSGFRIAAAGAIAVATVDALYCAVAVTLRLLAESWIDALGAAPALVSGMVLVTLGIAGLARARDTASPADASHPRSPSGAFVRFASLTAINPATLLYFLALATTLTSSFRLEGTSAAFVAGVGVASVAWQLGLAGAGALLARRARSSGQRMISAAGSAIVLVLGVGAVAAAALNSVGN